MSSFDDIDLSLLEAAGAPREIVELVGYSIFESIKAMREHAATFRSLIERGALRIEYIKPMMADHTTRTAQLMTFEHGSPQAAGVALREKNGPLQFADLKNEFRKALIEIVGQERYDLEVSRYKGETTNVGFDNDGGTNTWMGN